jgi:hypothetical protein
MESVLIITPRNVSINQLREAASLSCTPEDIADDGFVVQTVDSRIHVRPDDMIVSELEVEQLSQIQNIIAEPAFFVVDFSDIKLCKKIIVSVANRADFLVDNDHGVLCSGSDFVKTILEFPLWDWRLLGQSRRPIAAVSTH